jgi:anti-anti-sigma factor
MTEPLATMRAEPANGTTRITVDGEIDLSNADELEHQITEATEGMQSVTVDLRNVAYMDSRGVRIVHQLSRRLAAAGVDLKVLAPSSSFAGGVLRLTGLPDLQPDDVEP